MEKQIKIVVYGSLAVAILVFYFLYQLADQLANIENEAYYMSDYGEEEAKRKQMSFEYLDSLGGEKNSWFLNSYNSYPEMLDWNIKWRLRSDKGLDGEFSWQPDYKEILRNLSNQKNNTFLIRTLEDAPKFQTSTPFFTTWEAFWKENGDPALKTYFPICAEAKDNVEAFSILRKELLAYLPKAQIILEERLKNAGIKAFTSWTDGNWTIEIETKGWLNRKAFRLLMESKGELNIHDLSYDNNLRKGLLYYDRYLNQENSGFEITESISTESLENFPDGPILSALEVDLSNYSEYSPAFNARVLKESDTEAVLKLLEDSLAYKYLPLGIFFAQTKTFKEKTDYFENNPSHLLALNALHNTALPVNGYTTEAIVVKTKNNKFNSAYYDVFFQFDQKEKIEAWKNKTIQDLGRRVAFVLDGEIIFMPQINEYILDGKVVIFDDFSKATAYSLASLVSSPTLYVGGALEAKNWGMSAGFRKTDYQQLTFISLTIGLIIGTILLLIQLVFVSIRARIQP